MYKRIRDGLFDPRKVVDYIGDKAIYPILSVILFALIICIPDIFHCIQYEVDYETKSMIISSFNDQNIQYKIIDGELVYYGTEQNPNVVISTDYGCILIDDASIENYVGYALRFDEDGVNLEISGLQIKIMDYTQYVELQGFDLNTLTNGKGTSWDIMFSVVNKVYQTYMPMLLVFIIISGLISNAGILMLTALLFSLGTSIRLKNTISFGSMLKMNIYYLAPLTICSLIDGIFDIHIIFIVGVIITLIYTNIGQVEVWKRVYGHHTEG